MIRVNDRNEITQSMVRDWFNYDVSTGVFTRTKDYDSHGKIKPVERVITHKNNRGYLWTGVFGKTCLVHRLVWLWMTGKHPEGEIDHINGVRTDNRWVNLRDVNSFENSRNQGVRKDCTSGVRGVTWCDRTNHRGRSYWLARISHKGKRYTLGRFNKLEDAIKARREAEEHFKYHPNHAKRESYRHDH